MTKLPITPLGSKSNNVADNRYEWITVLVEGEFQTVKHVITDVKFNFAIG